MRRRAEIRVASRLGAGTRAVCERMLSEEGINEELGPWMRMTVPRGVESLDLETIQPGRLGRSWVLLFGVIPFDYDDIGLERIDPERGFLERSTMLSQRLWEHERTVEPVGEEACTIVDRVAWEPRLPLPGHLLRPLFRATFRHRHRQLRRRFGGEEIAASD